MRYLGEVYTQSASPHIRDLCLVEMLARRMKLRVNQRVAELTLEWATEY